MNLVERAKFLLKKRSRYRATFENDHGKAVLADLRRFCGYGDSPLVTSQVRQQVDTHATAVKIGRAEVFARILAHLHMDDAALQKMKDYIDD